MLHNKLATVIQKIKAIHFEANITYIFLKNKSALFKAHQT